MEKEQALETITTGALVLLIGTFISKLLAYGYRLAVARIGTTEYGLISLAITITSVLAIISSLGIGAGVLRFVAYYNEKKEKEKVKGVINYSIILTTIIAMIFAILIFFFSDIIATNFFKEQELSIILKITALLIPLSTLSNIFINIVRSFKKVEYEVYFKNILDNLLRVIFILLFIKLGYGIVGVAIALPLATAITIILLFYTINKKVFRLFDKEVKAFYEKKELLLYSLPLVFNTFAFMIIAWTDTLLLGVFKTASEVGIYNAAMPTSQLMFMIPNVLMILFMPVLTGLYAKNKTTTFNSIYRTITRWIFAFCAISAAFFIIFGNKFLAFFFGSEYAAGAAALAIIASAYLIYYTTLSSNRVLLILKKTNIILVNTLIGAILNIILNIILIPKYGIEGAAIATGISLVTIAVLQLAETIAINKFMPLNLRYINIIFSTLIASGIMFLIKDYATNIIFLLLEGALMMALFIGLLFLTKSITKSDKFVIRSIKGKVGL